MTTMGNDQYRDLVEHGPSMVWRGGLDGRRDYFNATWLGFTGRALQHELGAGWLAGVHPDDAAARVAAERAQLVRQEQFEVEYRLRRSDGVYRCVSERGVPYVDAAGAFAGFIGSCTDVEERQARDEAFGADDFFAMSLDNLCVAGYDGYFKRLNPSWTRTLGWSAEELMSKPSESFLHPDDHAATLAGRKRLHVGAPLGPLVNRYRCKDGSYRWFEWRSVAHADRGQVYAAARDITEQKQAAECISEAKAVQEKLELQLVFADRMASVGTLAAGAAHEINNPLAYATTNLALMLEALAAATSSPLVTELTALALEARQGAERVRKIVRGLKTFSRAEEERRSVIEVHPLLDLSIDMTSNEIRQRAQLVKEYGAIPTVNADDSRLGQVFINLLINAAQALPEGDSAAHEIRIVTSTDAEGRAVIEVRDTGMGIPAKLLGRVFDPFFTTKPVGVGTGLGLAICHNLITGMGGEITVQSQEGRGTTMRIVLPAASALRGHAAVAALPRNEGAAVGAVLVVDDEPSIGSALGRVLRAHDVSVVTTARQALALISAGKHFDVILADLMMPEMSGMDFYDELARHAPQLLERVIFISGGAFTPSANAFLDRVPNVRIEKPFDAQNVRALVERFIR